MDDNFTLEAKKINSTGKKIEVQYANNLYKMGDLLQSVLGFLVIVPSNPENSFFQIVEVVLNFLKKEEWGQSEISYSIQLRVIDSCVRYLSSQMQTTLPYRV